MKSFPNESMRALMYCTNLRVSHLYDENDCLLSENKDVTLVRVYKSVVGKEDGTVDRLC